jgi:threonyl-tRNA synthetase
VAILPVSEKYNEYAQKLLKYYDEQGVRAVLDDRNEKIGRKIRDNEMKRIPYMLIVGEKEQADGTVSFRQQGGGEQGVMKFEDFAAKINEEVRQQTENY